MKYFLITLLLLASLQSCAVTVPAAGFYYLAQETETPTHNEEWGNKQTAEAMELNDEKQKEIAKLRLRWDEYYAQNIASKMVN